MEFLTELATVASRLQPILECIAIVVAGFALFKWLRERSDRASDVLLSLEAEFEKKCQPGRRLLENTSLYRTVSPILDLAVRNAKKAEKAKAVVPTDVDQPANSSKEIDAAGIAAQTDIDNLLRFYVVLLAVRQQRQVSDTSLAICYRYWLAHYYRKDRREFRCYVYRFFPHLRGWLRADVRPWQRFRQRPFSGWWRPFFRPEDFWEEADIERTDIESETKR
jgi:hypothetical protein